MIRFSKKVLSNFFGNWESRRVRRDAQQHPKSIAAALSSINQKRMNFVRQSGKSPIFLCSVGWRSGSTLLQRLITSSGEIFIWGEPYDKSNIVKNMMKMIQPMDAGWPPEKFYYDGADPSRFKNSWIANLYPDLNSFHLAHLAFYETLFASPAMKAGVDRWGVKEVRWGEEEVLYLNWIYPQAKFIFLIRNPYDAYSSYRFFNNRWFAEWPDRPINTPYAFGKHWSKLALGLDRCKDKVDAMTIRYEDLISMPTKLAELEDFLSIHIDRAVMEYSVGGSHEKESLTFTERALISVSARRAMLSHGYSP